MAKFGKISQFFAEIKKNKQKLPKKSYAYPKSFIFSKFGPRFFNFAPFLICLLNKKFSLVLQRIGA